DEDFFTWCSSSPFVQDSSCQEPPKTFSNPLIGSLKDLFIFPLAARSNLTYAVQSTWKRYGARYRALRRSKARRDTRG
ncbi:hypothetical protein TorRG33x02_271850, partial [Trema orientale]